jgi:hypothetical protein
VAIIGDLTPAEYLSKNTENSIYSDVYLLEKPMVYRIFLGGDDHELSR